MPRLHIPFRTGEAANLTATEIRTRAAQLRQDALAQYIKDWPDSKEPKLCERSAARSLGGRLYDGTLNYVPLGQSLSLEVWGPQDFVLYEHSVYNHGSALLSFAYIGSYLMHFLDCPEKWTAEDGSQVGMQWASGRESASSLTGKPRKEAFTFAWEVIAPYDVVKAAIDLMGERDCHMPFAGQLRMDEVHYRAKALGLIVPEGTPA